MYTIEQLRTSLSIISVGYLQRNSVFRKQWACCHGDGN